MSSCTFSWEQPEFDGGSPIAGYFVEKLNEYNSRWSKVNRNVTLDMALEMNDLEEGGQYEYRVSAVNVAGTGKPSQSTGRFTAKNPYDPPSKPEAPVVDEITEEEANLSWTPPVEDGGSPITGYIVEMKPKGYNKWKLATTEDVIDTRLNVIGLNEGVEYDFRITALNKAGSSAPSAPTKAKYGENMFINQILLYFMFNSHPTLSVCKYLYYDTLLFTVENLIFVRPLEDVTLNDLHLKGVFECEMSKAGLQVDWQKNGKTLKTGDKYEFETEDTVYRLGD